MGPCKHVFIPRWTLPIYQVYLSVPPLSPYLLSLLIAFSLLSILSVTLSCTPQTPVSTVSIPSWFSPILVYPPILSWLLYAILSQIALPLLSPVQPYQLWYGRQPLFRNVPQVILPFQLSRVCLCFNGVLTQLFCSYYWSYIPKAVFWDIDAKVRILVYDR